MLRGKFCPPKESLFSRRLEGFVCQRSIPDLPHVFPRVSSKSMRSKVENVVGDTVVDVGIKYPAPRDEVIHVLRVGVRLFGIWVRLSECAHVAPSLATGSHGRL